jgi:hypothetical protein
MNQLYLESVPLESRNVALIISSPLCFNVSSGHPSHIEGLTICKCKRKDPGNEPGPPARKSDAQPTEATGRRFSFRAE